MEEPLKRAREDASAKWTQYELRNYKKRVLIQNAKKKDFKNDLLSHYSLFTRKKTRGKESKLKFEILHVLFVCQEHRGKMNSLIAKSHLFSIRNFTRYFLIGVLLGHAIQGCYSRIPRAHSGAVQPELRMRDGRRCANIKRTADGD